MAQQGGLALAASGGPHPGGPAATGRASPADLRRAAEEFEGVFIAQVLSQLTTGLGGAGLTGGGEDDPFASMLRDEYAKVVSRSGGLGVADAVLREMLKAQEVG